MKNQTSPLLSKTFDFYDSASTGEGNTKSPQKTAVLLQSSSFLVKSASARDHLANERTYLAWVRTGLALFGASIALLKWDDISSVTAYIVALLGLMVLIISTRRYFRVMHQLLNDEFEPNTSEALLVVALALLAITSTFVLHELGELEATNTTVIFREHHRQKID